MAKSKIIFESKEEIFGKFIRTNEYICYSGKLMIYDKKAKPVTLQIKCEYNNFVLEDFMEEQKTFSGNSVTEVYSKLSKWLFNYEIIFQNQRKSRMSDETCG